MSRFSPLSNWCEEVVSEFWTILSESLANGACLAVVLSKTQADAELRKVSVRPIVIGKQARYQFSYQRTDGKETHENLDPDAAGTRVAELVPGVFANCHLFTSEADYAFRFRRDGRVNTQQSAPTKQREENVSHDRTKKYLIPEGEPCPFLIEIGVMTPAGKVRRAKYAKFRQINRFLELIDEAVEQLPSEGKVRVVDFGCGKSYLTFALHHLLTAIRGREVEITGLDRKAEVVEDCSRIATKLGCEGLEFRASEIADHVPAGRVDMAVSLHACDTATDDALAKAISWGAGVILAVPCCQHELSGKLRADKLRDGGLQPVERHGILHERFAALATDALRAEALELCGYATQVLEFIDMEHTAKNLLIRAVRREDGATPERSPEAYLQFKQLLGLDELYLEDVLGARLGDAVQP